MFSIFNISIVGNKATNDINNAKIPVSYQPL